MPRMPTIAWISVYTADTGWLNGIIEFDGNVWTWWILRSVPTRMTRL